MECLFGLFSSYEIDHYFSRISSLGLMTTVCTDCCFPYLVKGEVRAAYDGSGFLIREATP